MAATAIGWPAPTRAAVCCLAALPERQVHGALIGSAKARRRPIPAHRRAPKLSDDRPGSFTFRIYEAAVRGLRRSAMSRPRIGWAERLFKTGSGHSTIETGFPKPVIAKRTLTAGNVAMKSIIAAPAPEPVPALRFADDCHRPGRYPAPKGKRSALLENWCQFEYAPAYPRPTHLLGRETRASWLRRAAHRILGAVLCPPRPAPRRAQLGIRRQHAMR